MKARKNPTFKQLLRRRWRHPDSISDPRYEKDAYWRLRLEGHPHAFAIRAFRDVPPKITEYQIGPSPEGLDPEDILFPVGTPRREIEVIEIRPSLTMDVIPTLQPRQSEYTVWDGNLSGFGVRVRASGYKSFVFHYRTPGIRKLKKITIGSAENMSLSDARDIALTIRSERCPRVLDGCPA